MRRARLRRVVLAAAIAAAVGCESQTSTASRDALGTIDVRIGREEQKIPFATIECLNDDDEFTLSGTRPIRTRAATMRYPDVLVAQKGPDAGVQATVFAFDTTWAGEPYDVILFVGEAAAGAAHRPSCSLSGDDRERRLECRNATPIPWQSPGGPPPVEFSVEFECPIER